MAFPKNMMSGADPDGDAAEDAGQGAPAPAKNPFKKSQMKGYKAGVRKIRNTASTPKGIRKSGGIVKGPSATKAFSPDK